MFNKVEFKMSTFALTDKLLKALYQLKREILFCIPLILAFL